VPGLGTSFGRGGATTAQQDLSNADAILIMGSSMAENHPVGFQWVMEARERGAKLIHVDPRFTRTSAMADLWVPLRAGSDIAFLGGMIRYVLENHKEFRDYVVAYTNGSAILREDFKDTEDLDGFFSGWDDEKKQYDPTSWLYERQHLGSKKVSGGGQVGDPALGETDPTLEHPRCVYQILKRHFSRYTPEMVERCCGVAEDVFLRCAETFANASGPERTAAICYAVGWTQHSKGVQVIRSAAILQLLLGNIGRPGGGILALRGHASIQGSTDVPTLYDILPGYLPMPFFESDRDSLVDYIKQHKTRTGMWSGFDSYFISLLKAYYGDGATAENDYGFNWLPRVTGDHSQLGYWLDMQDGKMEGLFVMGQNPAVGAPNGKLQRSALGKLKWLVVRDLVETETASFWYASPEAVSGELPPERIGTEIFLFPAAGTAEKAGTFTNTQRLLQFRNKAVDPPGDSRGELWFMYHLGTRLKEKARRNPAPRNGGLLALTWDYPLEGRHAEPEAEAVLEEINGYRVRDRTQLKRIADLKHDGSTACGAWIYCGVFPEKGRNRANERKSKDLLGHGWGFSWPNDCRILYNRASARPDGQPWSERKKLVWWDGAEGKWTGNDTPDFPETTAPDAPSNLQRGRGVKALGGARPFTLHQDGVAWLYVPSGLRDGPLPTHYEPLESPVHNPLYRQEINPPAKKRERPDNPYAKGPADPRYPYVLMTYRLTEHHTAGGMSRYLPRLSELQPEMFVEVSPELAAERSLANGGFAAVTTPRGSIQARVLVTRRLKPVHLNGKTIHQVGMPYHWGYAGVVKGAAANDLLVISQEPNVRIMETKALVCNIVPIRGEHWNQRNQLTPQRVS
jgi:formate dehydrogenase major subunit